MAFFKCKQTTFKYLKQQNKTKNQTYLWSKNKQSASGQEHQHKGKDVRPFIRGHSKSSSNRGVVLIWVLDFSEISSYLYFKFRNILS